MCIVGGCDSPGEGSSSDSTDVQLDGIAETDSSVPDTSAIDIQCPLVGPPCDRFFGADPCDVDAGPVITLGALIPRSGALGDFGVGIENGLRLAVSEINQSGGVLDMKVGVLSCDDGSTPVMAVNAARHLVDVGRVDAIIGAGASASTIEAFNNVARAAGVLMVSPSSTSPAISTLPDNGLLWRTAPSDAVQGLVIARYLLAAGYSKLAVVNRNDAYGNGIAASIQVTLCNSSSFSCDSGTYVNRVYTNQAGSLQATEQSQALNDLKSFAPDAVVLIGYLQDGIDFLNLASGSGFRFVLTDGMRDTALHGRGGQVGVGDPSIACSLIGTAPSDPSGELFDAFALKYEAQFRTLPAPYSANAYDATYIVALAYAAARGAGIIDPNGVGLAHGLTRLSDGIPIPLGSANFNTAVSELSIGPNATVNIRGISGPLDFDAALGEAPAGIEMWRLDPSQLSVSNLGVVYDGQVQYDFAAVLQAEPTASCNIGP